MNRLWEGEDYEHDEGTGWEQKNVNRVSKNHRKQNRNLAASSNS